MDSPFAYDEFFEPVALALGHLILSAAILEDAMLADLIQRRVFQDGSAQVFGGRLMSRLDRKPAGVLLDYLRKAGYDEKFAAEIAVAIKGRNRFIHHLFEDAEFLRVLASRKGIDGLVKRIEDATASIYSIVGKLAPNVTVGAETMFGRSAPELLALLRELEPNDIDDPEQREQLLALRELPESLFDESSDEAPRGRPDDESE